MDFNGSDLWTVRHCTLNVAKYADVNNGSSASPLRITYLLPRLKWLFGTFACVRVTHILVFSMTQIRLGSSLAHIKFHTSFLSSFLASAVLIDALPREQTLKCPCRSIIATWEASMFSHMRDGRKFICDNNFDEKQCWIVGPPRHSDLHLICCIDSIH